MNHLVGAGSLAGDAVMATPYRDPVTFTASKSRPHTKSFPERPKPRLPGSAPSKIRTCDLLLKRHSLPSAVLTCESTGQPGAKAQMAVVSLDDLQTWSTGRVRRESTLRASPILSADAPMLGSDSRSDRSDQ